MDKVDKAKETKKVQRATPRVVSAAKGKPKTSIKALPTVFKSLSGTLKASDGKSYSVTLKAVGKPAAKKGK